MKAKTLKTFFLKRGNKVKKGEILNLSELQFQRLKSAGLVKEATEKDVENYNKKLGRLKEDTPKDETSESDTGETSESDTDTGENTEVEASGTIDETGNKED